MKKSEKELGNPRGPNLLMRVWGLRIQDLCGVLGFGIVGSYRDSSLRSLSP